MISNQLIGNIKHRNIIKLSGWTLSQFPSGAGCVCGATDIVLYVNDNLSRNTNISVKVGKVRGKPNST